MSRLIVAIALGALFWMPVSAVAQTPAAAPSPPTPGKPSVKTDMVPSLFVMNAPYGYPPYAPPPYYSGYPYPY